MALLGDKFCWISCLTIVGFYFSCSEQSPREDDRPNILWILAEDFSPDLGCYGNQLIHTPNIDALAAKGMRFSNVFTTAPVCAPSRTALATGMYQTSLNAHHMRYPHSLKNELPDHVVPINELMRRSGYQTLMVTDHPGRAKEDWSFKSDIAKYDFLHWDSLQSSKPFFGVCNLRLTHRPFERDSTHPVDPRLVTIPPYYPDHPIVREDWAAYLETAQVLDQQVGQVLGELKRRNFDHNTIVFFFADHGRPMSRGKNHHFDSGIHIPLIIFCPDHLEWKSHLPAGGTNDDLISAIDLTATSLAMTGTRKPDWMQGKVFLGVGKDSARNLIFCASDRIGGSHRILRSVRSKEYKYIRNFNPGFSINASATAYRKAMHPIHHVLNIYAEQGKLTSTQKVLVDPFPMELLFHIENDPFEISNLAEDPKHLSVLLKMRRQLKIWQGETTDFGMQEDSEELRTAFAIYRQSSHDRYAKQINTLEDSIREATKVAD